MTVGPFLQTNRGRNFPPSISFAWPMPAGDLLSHVARYPAEHDPGSEYGHQHRAAERQSCHQPSAELAYPVNQRPRVDQQNTEAYQDRRQPETEGDDQPESELDSMQP